MKRCPQCHFIYNDSDQQCDFDNTTLLAADDTEIDAAASPVMVGERVRAGTKPGWKRKAPPIAIVLLLGLFTLAFYYFGRRIVKTPALESATFAPSEQVIAPQPPEPLPSPSQVPTASPMESPSPRLPSRSTNSPAIASRGPVSTGGTGTASKRGGKPVILLTGGGQVEADEVWRTRDGIWYRRDGVVTLLKRNRVKAIVNQ